MVNKQTVLLVRGNYSFLIRDLREMGEESATATWEFARSHGFLPFTRLGIQTLEMGQNSFHLGETLCLSPLLSLGQEEESISV